MKLLALSIVLASCVSTGVFAAAVPNQLAKRGEKSGKIHAEWDEEHRVYLVNAAFGTPLQKGFKMILDTGSAPVWVLSTTFPDADKLKPPHKPPHSVFDPKSSSTFGWYPSAAKPEAFKQRYLDQSVAEGHLGHDTAVIGDETKAEGHITIDKDAIIGQLEKITPARFFEVNPEDGVLGVGLHDPKTGLPSFFERIRDTLKEPVLTAALPFQRDGVFEFGALDASKHERELHWFKVDNLDQEQWNVRVTQANTDGADKSYRANIDTGSEALVLTPAQIKQLIADFANSKSKIEVRQAGNDGYIIPCKINREHLEDVVTKVLTFTLTTKAEEKVEVSVKPENLYTGEKSPGTNDWCEINLSNNGGMEDITLGVPFFNSNFVAYRLLRGAERGEIGFAPLK